MNEGLFNRLSPFFEVHLCTDGSYLSIGRSNQCRRQRVFTVNRYLQDKSVNQRGQDHINIISVESGYSFSCLALSLRHSHLGYKQTGLRLEYSCYGTFESLLSHGSVHELSCSLCVSLVCRLLLEELLKYYSVVYVCWCCDLVLM